MKKEQRSKRRALVYPLRLANTNAAGRPDFPAHHNLSKTGKMRSGILSKLTQDRLASFQVATIFRGKHAINHLSNGFHHLLVRGSMLSCPDRTWLQEAVGERIQNESHGGNIDLLTNHSSLLHRLEKTAGHTGGWQVLEEIIWFA